MAQVQVPQSADDAKRMVRTNPIKSFLVTVIHLYAIYLSFKCNKGFQIGHFLAALCCSPFYIMYQFAVNYKKCIR